MEFSVGDSVEAVDQLGIWTKAKVVSKSDNAIASRFPGEFISSVNKRKISHLHQRSCALHDLRKHAGMSANSSE